MIALPRVRAIAPRVEVVAEAGSTNTMLRERAADGDAWPHLSVLLTDNQTAGRGRLDRRWTAPAGTSLAVSLLLRRLPDAWPARGWIPLAAGLAMAEAVADQVEGRAVTVKWPNDVLVDGSKICGILAEAAEQSVILGTGINVSMTALQLPVPTATSFAVLGVEADVDRLLERYILGLDGVLGRLRATGDARTSGLHAAVTARCSTLGQEVVVLLPEDRTLEGTAVGLEDDGRLIVSDGATLHAVAAGDVVHVRPNQG
ncbi:biotin--[acetyl-CoA-carboxylase] ligase [uncultured Microbacterium sp.]|uniref:biotin--[acetyl-CoA-carboxylase] ligase n=1 Tax=uncultured Microbacterium sp. TaxID=191216 RepID=UPI0028D8A23F|nr:biotin--[acetyl-CoA-carboxylase] ligase [uncultured Microbacterium sp.]